MPKSYSNDTCRPIFNMSRDRYVSFDNAKPLMKILDDEKVPVLAADYVIKTDTDVRSEMDWEDVKKLVARLDAVYRQDKDFGEIFKFQQVKRKYSPKPDYVEITLPTKDIVSNCNTEGFLVLIAADKSNVIMPKYFDFMMKMLPEADAKGNIMLKSKIRIEILGMVQIKKHGKRNGVIYAQVLN